MKKKLLNLAYLAALVSALGCAPAATEPEPASPAPASDESAQTQATPPKGRLVQANPKLATLKAKFVYDGKAPARAKVDSSKDPICAPIEILSDAMLVGKDGEIQNLVLMFDAKRSEAKVPAEMQKAPEGVVKLDNNGCVFKPHIFFARVGQTIEVTNTDQTGHNANFNFLNNSAVNFLIPIGGSKKLDPLATDEPTLMPVDCNIHPWMKAFVIVQDHPYVGISDESGQMEIIDLPVGKVTFLIRHEYAEGAIDEGKVNGKAQKWSRGRMELELKAGVNDLGTILLAPDKFKS